jgi:hypothetical protein
MVAIRVRNCARWSAGVSLNAIASRLQGKFRQPPPVNRLVARGCEPSARQAERSEKRGVRGRQSPPATQNTEGWPYSRNQPRVHERKAPGRAPVDVASGIVLGQLLSNVCMRTKKHRLFRGIGRLTGRAPADDALGQAPQNSSTMRLNSRRRRREAPHAGGLLSMAT